jgi:predicted alternative tryptophan synthase beta-subunit
MTDPVVVPSEVPTHWYNLAADLPEPCPPALHRGPASRSVRRTWLRCSR